MTIKLHERLLLTGAAGGLGQALRDRLKANCSTLRMSDRLDFGAAREGEEVMLADLADLADADAVHATMVGVDAIVHMGGISVEGQFAPIRQANILGVYNRYEAAREHGTKRVVFASSKHVPGFYKQSETITADRPARPDGYYGLDNSRARHVGYAPQDSADVFRQAIYARTPAPDLNDPAVQHQGGGFVRMGLFE